jgi:prefoldin subunit 5
MSEWDGKVVISTPGGQLIEMSLGEYVARKNAEVEHLRAENERLRENVDRLGKEVERADRLREEIARVKADNRSLVNRALEAKP